MDPTSSELSDSPTASEKAGIPRPTARRRWPGSRPSSRYSTDRASVAVGPGAAHRKGRQRSSSALVGDEEERPTSLTKTALHSEGMTIPSPFGPSCSPGSARVSLPVPWKLARATHGRKLGVGSKVVVGRGLDGHD